MRAALWLVSLFAVAVATALLASNNAGTVAIFWAPYRVDLSLNLVLLGLVMILLTLHWAQRALTALFELPRQAKRWRLQQKERAAHGALLDAMAQFMEGRTPFIHHSPKKPTKPMEMAIGTRIRDRDNMTVGPTTTKCACSWLCMANPVMLPGFSKSSE